MSPNVSRLTPHASPLTPHASLSFDPFDVYHVALDRPTLIEASAGTGKTWAISGLFVRLILERELAVENILVVTYTKAAMAELSARIRQKLAAMLMELKGQDSGDEFCKTYLAREELDRQLAIRRLTHAMRCFDDAAIFTIHGFCQRVLTESAFESGMEFDTELLPDETEILRDIVDDYWRREIQPARGAWVDYLVSMKQSPDAWLAEMRPHIGKQDFLTLSPLVAVADFPGLEAALDAAYAPARTLWQRQREDITKLLLEHTGLNGVSYKKSSMADWFGQFDLYFAAATPGLVIPDKLVKLTPAELQVGKGTKKNCTPPEHPFFAACAALLDAAGRINDALAHRLTALKADLLRYCEQELPARKHARLVFSYHDLLNGLYQALNSLHGEHLAALVRSRYPAALIDEFQDTDPIQYRIFQHLYHRDQALPAFFVGDPKQAIYGFRGADVYTYLDAYRDTAAQKTQNTNQRSIPALVKAVNALFAGSRPFLVENIDYRPVEPTTRALGELVVQKTEDRGQRTEGGGQDSQSSAFQFQLFPAYIENDKEKSWSKDAANVIAAQAAATEIARLLTLAGEGRAYLVKDSQTRPLNGGDIAVLAPGHRQGKLVQEELVRRRVPSVRRGQDNVFEAREALELELVLQAIAEPGRGSLVNAALATEAMGMTAVRIVALAYDEHAAEQVFDAFSRYHELWRDHGFMCCFRAWLIDYEVAQRLLRFPDGERRLTNLLHLAELIQIESQARHGMDALLGWLSRAIHAPRDDDEESMLRLESDAKRVQIVTIHASKGLEYPVVFCPFLWDGQLWRKNETTVTFHDADNDHQPTLDLGSSEFAAHKALAGTEKLAEKLRLLYVALTRAQHRCYVTWGNVSEVESSALAWLLHGQDADPARPLESMSALLKTAGSAVLEQAVRAYAKRADASVETLHQHQKTEDRRQKTDLEEGVFDLRPLSSALCPLSSDVGWRMTSFSALSAGKHSEAPDYDALPAAPVEAPPALDIFAFPRGAQPGTCLHAIFEEWEFTRNDPAALQAWVADRLRAYFIDEKWAPVVAHSVAATLDAPLDTDCALFPSAQGVLFPATGGIRLADAGPSQRLVELGFAYPINRLDVTRLRRLLADPALKVAPEFVEAAQTLDFRQVNGYMMGFIDLVFEARGRYYIVDYKSNWLGPELASYAPPQLKQAMAATHYYLQYLIYCVALHRYLRVRLTGYDYRRHFGGVYYLFLRGIDPAHQADTGIYRDCPDLQLITALDRLMDGEGG
ncbi:MAG: exodeoxyribonuclease V subunit beta [Sulfuricellaceae bacterium]